MPRFWRMYLALWLIRRWRLPATPCLILPVAVSLKRFFTPLLVFSLGIFVSLFRDTSNQPWQPLLARPADESRVGEARALKRKRGERQARWRDAMLAFASGQVARREQMADENQAPPAASPPT